MQAAVVNFQAYRAVPSANLQQIKTVTLILVYYGPKVKAEFKYLGQSQPNRQNWWLERFCVASRYAAPSGSGNL